jgi:hypothetical protein
VVCAAALLAQRSAATMTVQLSLPQIVTAADRIFADAPGGTAMAAVTSTGGAPASTTYLVEVAQSGMPAGGTLQMHADVSPQTCEETECVAGRAPKALRCMAEWISDPPPPANRRVPGKIVCHDGDSCDADNDPNNNSCTFQVALCLNNHDPALHCTPTNVTLIELLSPRVNGLLNTPGDNANAGALLTSFVATGSHGRDLGICLNAPVSAYCVTNADCNSPGKNDGRCYRFVRFQPPLTAPDQCGVSADVVVPLRVRRDGTFGPGLKRLRIKATNTDPRSAFVSLVLRCLPKN